MFERFTDRARRVVVLAQEEARMLRHNYIGTEHLLLGLIHEGQGIAAQVLAGMDVDLQAARSEVERVVGRGRTPPASHIPFTPRAKRVLEHSLRQAQKFGHNYIGSEHLLLGLLEEDRGVGLQILQELGADRLSIRQQAVNLMTFDPDGAGIQQEFREEVSLSVHGPDAAEPRCPRCLEELGDRLRAQTRYATDDTEDERSHRVLVVWCGNCGTVLGTHPGAAE